VIRRGMGKDDSKRNWELSKEMGAVGRMRIAATTAFRVALLA